MTPVDPVKAAEADDRFANYTRSASFSLSMSHAMIHRLLMLDIDKYLADKYPWHTPASANFGDVAGLIGEWGDSTMQALTRRGLVDVIIPEATLPDDGPLFRHECFPLTTAGILMCRLLNEAGFLIEHFPFVKVRLHPDDRDVITAPDLDVVQVNRDRRDWENDAPYLSGPDKLAHRGVRA